MTKVGGYGVVLRKKTYRTIQSLVRFKCAVIGVVLCTLAGIPGVAMAQTKLADPENQASCASITPKEQLVLERRALGGDQQAQYVIATCAWLKNVANVQVVQSITPTELVEGDSVSVSIVVTNDDDGGANSNVAAARKFLLRDPIPRGLKLKAISSLSGKYSVIQGNEQEDSAIEVSIGDLPAGATAEIAYDAVVENLESFQNGQAARNTLGRQARLRGSVLTDYKYSQRDKVLYTYQWATLAYCDRQFNDLEAQVSDLEAERRIYRRTKPANDFRQKYEKQRQRERARLNEIRRAANDQLYLLEGVSVSESSRSFVSMMDGLGASGLISLAFMRDCPTYPNAQQKHVRAAIWQKADDAISHGFRVGSAADSSEPADWPAAFVDSINDRLSQEDQTLVANFGREYGLYNAAKRIENLELRASLGRMGEIPVQYLQLALGAFRKTTNTDFKYGLDLGGEFQIDNVYGERTSKLVKQAQSNYCIIRDVATDEDALRDVSNPGSSKPGEMRNKLEHFAASDDCSQSSSPRWNAEKQRVDNPEQFSDRPTGWLTPLQSRALICRAAVDREDPYSYMHLAQMFANGYGYEQNFDKAIFAVQRARRLFAAGPLRRSSNFRDLAGKKITNDYKKDAEALENEVYRKAAEVVLGRELALGTVDASVVATIDARISRANYDAPGNLCRDEIWRSTVEPQKYALSKEGAAIIGARTAATVDFDRTGIASRPATIEFPLLAPLPLSVSIDQPAPLDDPVINEVGENRP